MDLLNQTLGNADANASPHVPVRKAPPGVTCLAEEMTILPLPAGDLAGGDADRRTRRSDDRNVK